MRTDELISYVDSVVKGLDLVKSLSVAGINFLPINLPHQQIFVEALYSISKLIKLLQKNDVNSFDSLFKRSLISNLQLIAKSLSSIELFCEVASDSLLNSKFTLAIILLIESSKTICRLSQILLSSDSSMLINWNRDEQFERENIQTYKDYYQNELEKKLSNIIKLELFHTSTRSSLSFEGDLKHVGSRSGLVLKCSGDLANAIINSDSTNNSITSTEVQTNLSDVKQQNMIPTGQESSNSEINNLRSLEDSDILIKDELNGNETTTNEQFNQSNYNQDIVSPKIKSTIKYVRGGSRLSFSPSSLSDFNTPIKSERSDVDIDVDSISNDNAMVPLKVLISSVISTIQLAQLNEEEQFVTGEFIYTIRPMIYSLLTFLVTTEVKSDIPISTQLLLCSQPITSMISDWDSETLLRVLVLAISFTLEYISIQLTDVALRKLRSKANTIAQASVFDRLHINSKESLPDMQNVQNIFQESAINVVDSGLTPSNSHIYDKELQRRKMALYLYLLKSPLFDRTTYFLMIKFIQVTKDIPVVRSLPRTILQILQNLNKSHFVNSNSS